MASRRCCGRVDRGGCCRDRDFRGSDPPVSFLFRERRSVSPPDVFGARSWGDALPSETATVQHDVVWACVRLIADQIASAPLDVVRRDANSGRRIPVEYPWLADPSRRVDLYSWKFQAVVSLLLHGNAYGAVMQAVPPVVEWLHHGLVSVTTTSAVSPPTYLVGGVPLPPERILHVRGFTLDGQVTGVSVITAHRHTFGLGPKAQRFSEQFFDSGGHPVGLLRTDQKVDEQTARTIKERFVESVRSRVPAVLGNGTQYQPLSISPQDSQFLETQRYNGVQICRLFGVPPEMVGESSGSSMTYANIEKRLLSFNSMTVRPWATRLEQALQPMFGPDETAKFNLDVLVRSDVVTRYQAHRIALLSGFLCADEVRALEDLSPIPDGDKFQWPPIPTGVTPVGSKPDA